MYTLEDDQETSSRLHKRDFALGEQQLGTFSDPAAEDATQVVELPVEPILTPNTDVVSPQAGQTSHFSVQQITNSFKRLTTPVAGQTRSASERRIALAALTVACIGVFFTALDQTVVVTALPQIILDLHIPIIQLDHA